MDGIKAIAEEENDGEPKKSKGDSLVDLIRSAIKDTNSKVD